MFGICGNAQREGHFAGRSTLKPSNLTALSSAKAIGSKSTGISAILVSQNASNFWIVIVALLPILTYLCEIDQSMRMITPEVDRHVKVPKDKVAFLECVGLVLDTGIIHEDKIKVVLRTSLHKIDRYFYETIIYIVFMRSRIGYIPFKWT